MLGGKKVAQSLYASLEKEVATLSQKPKLVVLLVGEDPASQTYVRNKAKRCEKLGFEGETIQLPSTVTETDLFAVLDKLNSDRSVNGILVQLPLPDHISKYRVIDRINPMKDVDGLHPSNVGLFFQGRSRFSPCTPAGIVEILKFYSVPLEGANCVVVGRSEIVGKPLAQLMIQQNCTVTVCHSKTKDLAAVTKGAEILIVAIGKPNFVNAEFVAEGVTIVDVGIHRIDGKWVGDVDFSRVMPLVSRITPVPGGVGPMTIAMLMKNVVIAAKLQG